MAEANVYETAKSLREYLLFHYAAPELLMPHACGPKTGNFTQITAELCVESAKKYGVPLTTAMDLGCAVGRSSFELARSVDKVVGIDYSQSFVNACNSLKETGTATYDVLVEKNIFESATAVVDPAIDRSRVEFRQGDACELPEGLGTFNIVLMANLVDRLYDPAKCIRGLAKHVAPGGLAIFTSPFTWMEEYTKPEQWLGGPELPASADALRQVAESSGLKFLESVDIPFVIRETRRKFQFTVANCLIFQRA